MSSILEQMRQDRADMAAWFEHLHRHPELSMREERTAAYIADLVREWGYEVETGVGRHGVVASLSVGNGTRSIGLRADFDALPLQEDNELPYKSQAPGVAHLCGHDGHAAMLLAAGRHLARTRSFEGTLRLFFQPGEETMEGGPAMIRDGLFERFPVDAVFAMHNMPGLELGTFHFTPGRAMAAVDNWEIELTGQGAHGAMPELGVDAVVAGSSLVMALQSIVSRNVPAQSQAVVTVGAFLAGEAGNVVSHSALLRLSLRTTTEEERDLVLGRVRSIARHQAECYGCAYRIREGIPGAVLVNDPVETERAAAVARATFGGHRVVLPGPTFLASEDFAFMLRERKGTYCFLGNGPGPMVHHPQYQFNQELLPMGAAYWVALVEDHLR